LRVGATVDDIAEAIMVGVAMKASSALSHSVFAINAMEDFHRLNHAVKK
jgi:hypothetical protein